MTAKGAKQIPWTKEEDEIILSNRQHMSAKQLAELLPGRTWHAVRSRIRTLGLQKETKVMVDCDFCGNKAVKNSYEVRRNRLNFCGNECKNNYFKKDGNPNWKGGKSVQHGYQLVRESVSSKTPYKREHRAVMERYLGRKLEDWEIVHHINGDKTDNRIENLMVTTRSDHIKLHWKQGDFNKDREAM